MNSNLKQKLLLNLAKAKQNKGFTLIELLVVIIIIGVLSAVALPNLLGQVGQARETEAKNGAGAVNRGQQAFYTQNSTFLAGSTGDAAITDLNQSLGVGIELDVYRDDPTNGEAGIDLSNSGIVLFKNDQRDQEGTRDYAGGIQYNTDDRTFSTVVCRMDDANADTAITDSEISDAGLATDAATANVSCADDTVEVN